MNKHKAGREGQGIPQPLQLLILLLLLLILLLSGNPPAFTIPFKPFEAGFCLNILLLWIGFIRFYLVLFGLVWFECPSDAGEKKGEG